MTKWDTKGRARVEEGKPGRRRYSSFFTKFLEYFGAKEMYEEFQHLYYIYEVVIPSKRYIIEMRYGFVKLFNVRDEDLLAIKLDNIFIGNRNIFANLPRFRRRNDQ